MMFFSTRARVSNRGVPPTEFLNELVGWGRVASADIFEPNPNTGDIYSQIKPILGPWTSLLHRRAAMLEVMRVHAGFESGWNWEEGVDVTNATSVAHRESEETGIFQVSYDSMRLGHSAMLPFAVEHGIGRVGSFLVNMKADHQLAMEYYARLVRVNVKWAGPLARHEVDKWLSRAAMEEFQVLLYDGNRA